MRCNELPFDGVSRFKILLDSHLESRSIFYVHVWTRIIAPVQIIFILIETVVTQTLRSACLLLGGLLTCKEKTFTQGLADFCAVIAQIIALPIIAGATVIYPKWGQDLARGMINSVPSPSSNFMTKNLVRGSIPELVIGLISVPVSVLRSGISFVNKTLSLELGQALASLVLMIKEPIVNLFLTLAAFFSLDLRCRTLYSFSAAYLVIFSPIDELKSSSFHRNLTILNYSYHS